MNDSRRNDVFVNNTCTIINFMKNCNSIQEAYLKGIPIENNKGFLLPISNFMLNDDDFINLLAKWRTENSFAYPAVFNVTFNGTKTWLEKAVLKNDDRFLFLIVDNLGNKIGHIGVANCKSQKSEIEIDNVLKGNKDLQKDIIFHSINTIINWTEEILLPKRIYLKVLSDNEHAINFYKRNNFISNNKIPLKKVVSEDRVNWIESSEKDAEKYFIVMDYKSNFQIEKNKTILTAGTSITALENFYTNDASRYGWNNEWNKYIKRFEKEFSEFVDVKYAISTSSCTGALHLSLLALGIGEGDEVIVPDLTWVASAQVVNYVGAIPIFADIDFDSWTLDPVSFESKITKKTKAVIPVHTYGHPAEMDKIMAIAKKYNLYVIEDAAPSIGAEFKGKKTGSFGHFGAFSFQGAKLAVTGEGGMLVTNDDDLYNTVYKIWDQGRVPGSFWIDKVGWKYKMSNLNAAFGLGQIQRVNTLIEAKRQIFAWYDEFLKDCKFIKLNYEKEWARSIYWMSSIYLNDNSTLSRDEMIQELKKRNIDSRPVFPAISQYPIWPRKQEPAEISNKVGTRSINLPSGVCLKKEQIKYISSQIIDILNK